MKLEEIDIGKTNGSKRKAIGVNLGRQAILYDETYHWVHVLISNNDAKTTYSVKNLGPNKNTTYFHYEDLQKLMILYPLENRPLPEIKT